MKRLSAALLVLLAAGCASQMASAPTKALNDGELAVPADYKSWPKFLSEVQRPDAKQIREIWINPVGAKTKAGENFPHGTISVMELHGAKTNADGSVVTGPDGKLVKDKLLKVFVMGKGAGWGASAPDTLKNGDWIYSAFMADGKTVAPDSVATCRACHLPLTSKDFVHRYDEYFAKRGS